MFRTRLGPIRKILSYARQILVFVKKNQSYIGNIWSLLLEIGSTVRLRFRKSISGHHFQTIGKLASNDFNYHAEVVNSI